MTKEKYKEHIQKQYDYVSYCIDMTEEIYNDKDIDYLSYLELNEMINYKFREVCRIVKRG